jgi:hypothetical protein
MKDSTNARGYVHSLGRTRAGCSTRTGLSAWLGQGAASRTFVASCSRRGGLRRHEANTLSLPIYRPVGRDTAILLGL